MVDDPSEDTDEVKRGLITDESNKELVLISETFEIRRVYSWTFFFLSILKIFYLTLYPTNLDNFVAHCRGAGILTEPDQL